MCRCRPRCVVALFVPGQPPPGTGPAFWRCGAGRRLRDPPRPPLRPRSDRRRAGWSDRRPGCRLRPKPRRFGPPTGAPGEEDRGPRVAFGEGDPRRGFVQLREQRGGPFGPARCRVGLHQLPRHVEEGVLLVFVRRRGVQKHRGAVEPVRVGLRRLGGLGVQPARQAGREQARGPNRSRIRFMAMLQNQKRDRPPPTDGRQKIIPAVSRSNECFCRIEVTLL